jgi:hypothetical protein
VTFPRVFKRNFSPFKVCYNVFTNEVHRNIAGNRMNPPSLEHQGGWQTQFLITATGNRISKTRRLWTPLAMARRGTLWRIRRIQLRDGNVAILG